MMLTLSYKNIHQQIQKAIQCKTHPSKQWWDDVWDRLFGVVRPHKWRRWLLLWWGRQFARRWHLGGRLLAGGHHCNILLHLLWLAELLEQYQLHFLITQLFSKLAQTAFTLCKLCWWQFLHNSILQLGTALRIQCMTHPLTTTACRKGSKIHTFYVTWVLVSFMTVSIHFNITLQSSFPYHLPNGYFTRHFST